ncbi:hypothetical protein [Variovorax sp.]|uniref:hypothetical protein n=1 Tax=Variovorax sp. TaxID=1871043 RepID=UPI002D419A65|nr:hypothetical protein [Variovorax sp.]HYP83516.1 hypothetical protein [Variovorax sp.]
MDLQRFAAMLRPGRIGPGRRLAHALLGLAALLGGARDAGAVFTFTNAYGSYGLTLQVGSANAIDEIVFNVAGNNVGLTPAPVAGTNSSTNQAGVTVRVTPSRPFFGLQPDTVTLTVDSSLALSCQTPATCSGVSIPFTSIRWTSTDASSSAGANIDIQNGTFSGTAGQQLARFDPVALLQGSRQLSNTLNFEYANSTVYPAGTYRGTVRFTATML